MDMLRYGLVVVSGRRRCQVEHERFSLCYSHYEDGHGGGGKVVRNAEIPGPRAIINSTPRTHQSAQILSYGQKVMRPNHEYQKGS